MVDQTKMNLKDAQKILAQAFSTLDASILAQDASNESDIYTFTLDLTIARARSDSVYMSLPFTSVMIDQATDINTYVYLLPNTKDSSATPIRMGLKDIFSKDLGFSGAYVYWDAQPNKKVVMNFFVKGKPNSGRLVVDQNLSGNITLGKFSAPNDGFSYLLNNDMTISPANGDSIGINGMFPDDSNYFNPIVIGAGSAIGYLVPAGYQLRILGMIFKIKTAFTFSTGSNAYVLLCSASNSTGANEVVLLGGVPDAYTVGSTEYSAYISPSTTPPFNKNIVDEGRYVYFKRAGSGVLSAGLSNAQALVRLEKKVG